jgi:hypothetical protein
MHPESRARGATIGPRIADAVIYAKRPCARTAKPLKLHGHLQFDFLWIIGPGQ